VLWVRSYSGNEAMLTRVLLPALRAFWPPARFGRVYVVLDRDSPSDDAMARRLLDTYGGDEVIQRADAPGGTGYLVLSANPPTRRYGADGRPVQPKPSGRRLDDGGASGGTIVAPLGNASAAFTAAWRRSLQRAASLTVTPVPVAPVNGRSHLNDPLLTIAYTPSRAAGINGYHQQQLWTLYADQDIPQRFPPGSVYTAVGARTAADGVTPDGPFWADGEEAPADVIGIVDSDAMPITLAHGFTFFDEAGRPRVIPRVGLPIGDLWSQSAAATEFFLGVPEPFRGMSYFPVYMYRRHFEGLRAHVEARHGKPFVDVFLDMVRRGFYSQFNIMTAYLFHFHKADYSWHYFLPNQDNGEPLNRTPLFTHTVPGVTHDWSFLDNAAETEPYPRAWQHWKHHRFRGPIKQHLIRGFCWSVAGNHPLCARHSWWNQAPVHSLAHLDMWDFGEAAVFWGARRRDDGTLSGLSNEP
jgi:hypothetical protein